MQSEHPQLSPVEVVPWNQSHHQHARSSARSLAATAQPCLASGGNACFQGNHHVDRHHLHAINLQKPALTMRQKHHWWLDSIGALRQVQPSLTPQPRAGEADVGPCVPVMVSGQHMESMEITMHDRHKHWAPCSGTS